MTEGLSFLGLLMAGATSVNSVVKEVAAKKVDHAADLSLQRPRLPADRHQRAGNRRHCWLSGSAAR